MPPAAGQRGAAPPVRLPSASVRNPFPAGRRAVMLATITARPTIFPGRARLMKRSLFAALLFASPAGWAQAFTLDILHFNDFHSRIESINAFEFDLLLRRRGRRQVLRRRRPPGDRDQRHARRDQERRRQRAGARGGRRLPGLALLHHLRGRGRGRDVQRHGHRRHGLRQPRVRPRLRTAGEVRRGGRVPGPLRQRRHLRRPPARPRSPRITSSSTSAARRSRSSAPPRPTPSRSPRPTRRTSSAIPSLTSPSGSPRCRPTASTRSSCSRTSA